MKTRNRFNYVLLALAWALCLPALAQTNVATFYQHCNYGGYAVSLAAGDYTLSQLRAKGVTNDDLSSVKVTSGYEALVYEHDNYGGNALLIKTDVACLTANNFNDRISSLRVRKSDTSNPGWDNFKLPTINFQNKAPNHPGSTAFNRAIPNPVADMQAQVLEVVKKLHYNQNDYVKNFANINFYLEDFDGVAYTTSPSVTIVVSVRHINNVYNNAGGSTAAVREEILGILSHEATHGYNYEPKNAGGYTPGTEFYGFVEGIADYVRIAVGLHKSRTPRLGGNWKDGYTTSGFFINWLVNNKDRNFAIKFQHTARTFSTWSWDAACREILGVGVQALWDEYQQWIRDGKPGLPAAKNARTASLTGMEPYTCAPVTNAARVATQATIEAGSLVVSPNPAATTVSLTGIVSFPATVKIYNTKGALVQQLRVEQRQPVSVDCAAWASGVYLIRITSSGAVQKQRLVKY